MTEGTFFYCGFMFKFCILKALNHKRIFMAVRITSFLNIEYCQCDKDIGHCYSTIEFYEVNSSVKI